MRYKAFHVLSFGCLLASVPATAWAAGDTAEEQPTAPEQQASATEEPVSEGIQDIVVTAERRQDTAQRTSLSLQVLQPAVLARVSRPQDLNGLITGVQIGMAGANQQVFIRGVGDTAGTSNVQSSVTFNIDGVVLPRGTQAANQYFDLDRVEVLKGPQGTLYGRNSSGGVINIVTKRPVLDETSLNLGFQGGNFNLINVDAAVNLPISSTAALRVAGQIVSRDGYLSDGAQDQKTEAIRARLFWQPTDTIDVTLNGDYEHIGGQGSGVVLFPVVGGDPWRSSTQQPTAIPFNLAGPYTVPDGRLLRSNIWGTSAEVNIDLGGPKLTLIPSFRKQDQVYISYTGNARFVEQLDDKAQAFEARLGGESPALRWLVGAYYRLDDSKTQIDSILNGTLDGAKLNLKRRSLAGFGQATLTVADGFRIIAGARYTSERLTGTRQRGVSGYPLVPFTALTAVTPNEPATFNRFTWRLGVEADLSPRNLLFASVSTGFKGGGIDVIGTPANNAPNPYGPETVTYYLIGSKNRFFNGKLQVNLELFYLDYRNQQLTYVQPDPLGSISYFTRNIGKAVNKGVALDVIWQPTPADTFDFGVEYDHGRNVQLSFTQLGLGAYSANNRSLCSTSDAGGGIFSINCDGTPIRNLPAWSGRFRYEHKFQLASGNELRPAIFVSAASPRWLEVTYGLNGKVPSYVTLDGELTFYSPAKHLTLQAWVKNVTNETVYTSGLSVAPLAPNGARYYTATIAPPRTYGISARVSF